MIITKGAVINGTFALMRISGLTRNPVPEDIETGLQVADDYASEIKSTLDIGWQQPVTYGGSLPTDNSGISKETAGPLKKLLVVELLGYYGKQIPQSVALTAASGMRQLENLIVSVKPSSYPGTLPYGSGNEQAYRDRKFYPEAPANEGAINVFKDDILNYSYDFTDYQNWLIDDTLASVEWDASGSGIQIANVAHGTTITTGELTFTQIGGYTLNITATKNGSTDKLTVIRNFIVNEVPGRGIYP